MAKWIPAAFVVFVLSVALEGAFAPTDAQEQFVRVDGRVQWIGGQRMVVQADTGPSVGVDLASVPQGEYAGLLVRDRVAVMGTIAPDNQHVMGTSIGRGERAR